MEKMLREIKKIV